MNLWRIVVPASKFAVIYSQTTGRVRSWHNFNGKDETDDMLSSVCAAQGEAIALFPMEEYGDVFAIQALVNQITGLIPSNDRYAIIDPNQLDETGNPIVIGSVFADPDGCGDKIKDMKLIAINQSSFTAGP